MSFNFKAQTTYLLQQSKLVFEEIFVSAMKYRKAVVPLCCRKKRKVFGRNFASRKQRLLKKLQSTFQKLNQTQPKPYGPFLTSGIQKILEIYQEEKDTNKLFGTCKIIPGNFQKLDWPLGKQKRCLQKTTNFQKHFCFQTRYFFLARPNNPGT